MAGLAGDAHPYTSSVSTFHCPKRARPWSAFGRMFQEAEKDNGIVTDDPRFGHGSDQKCRRRGRHSVVIDHQRDGFTSRMKIIDIPSLPFSSRTSLVARVPAPFVRQGPLTRFLIVLT